MRLSRLTLPSKHSRNAMFKKIGFFSIGRILFAVLLPFLCGGGDGKSQIINQRWVLMQGSAQQCARGCGLTLRLGGWYPAVCPSSSWAALWNRQLRWPRLKISRQEKTPRSKKQAWWWLGWEAEEKASLTCRSAECYLHCHCCLKVSWVFPISLPRLCLEPQGREESS